MLAGADACNDFFLFICFIIFPCKQVHNSAFAFLQSLSLQYFIIYHNFLSTVHLTFLVSIFKKYICNFVNFYVFLACILSLQISAQCTPQKTWSLPFFVHLSDFCLMGENAMELQSIKALNNTCLLT